MCGIIGIINCPDIKRAKVDDMLKSMSHRGPDASGLYFGDDVCLGHTRLSILDLSDKANQPFQSKDGKLVMTYNGEIYNFNELRQGYLADETFETSSDTEVLLRLYRKFGEDCVQYIKGMFAFCIYDIEKRRAVLVRDRLGIKPLYYYQKGKTLVFASEIKAILSSGLYKKEIRPRSVSDYFINGNTVGPHTIFEGINEMEPGHVFVFDKGRLNKYRYWSLREADISESQPEWDYSELREKISAAVRSHLVSDVPVGLFLSGGIDSSSIASLAGLSGQNEFHTFTVRFDAGGHDESKTARSIADKMASTHHELLIDYKSMVRNLGRTIRCHDEPFGDAANLCIFSMSELARPYVKVVLCGDGGDEVFGGYRRYRGNLVASKLGPFLPPLGGLGFSPRYQRILKILGEKELYRRYALWMLPFSDGTRELYRFLDPAVFNTEAENEHFKQYKTHFSESGGRGIVNNMLYTDLNLLLQNTYLKKIDRPTMAHGLEARVPMLDSDLVEYVYSLPGSAKVTPWGLKVGMKKAMRGVVPDSILDSPKKGFGVPFEEWLRDDLKQVAGEVFSDPGFGAHGYFQQDRIREAWNDFQAGRGYYGHLLWYTLIFELWYQEYIN
ncbi:MAG: asparagine synthase (glutamine-hydrolyzing) [Nitrospirae bacterium]|nr:asparagine synthase (glutamine-hydrolyzing) [Nitrospirota bacterium]